MPRGPMDTAVVFGTNGCRFESSQGHICNAFVRPYVAPTGLLKRCRHGEQQGVIGTVARGRAYLQHGSHDSHTQRRPNQFGQRNQPRHVERMRGQSGPRPHFTCVAYDTPTPITIMVGNGVVTRLVVATLTVLAGRFCSYMPPSIA